MRKLLVLILVLGLASAANAMLIKVDDQVGESFEVNVQTTITVAVSYTHLTLPTTPYV